MKVSNLNIYNSILLTLKSIIFHISVESYSFLSSFLILRPMTYTGRSIYNKNKKALQTALTRSVLLTIFRITINHKL